MTRPARAVQYVPGGALLQDAASPRRVEKRRSPNWGASVPACFEPQRRPSGLTVRLAASAEEIRQAQALRYTVFYENGGATADARMRAERRDSDRFDAFCDHLLVVDEDAASPCGNPLIVGTYRLLPQEVADRHGGFYSAGEFELGPLLAAKRHLRFLELGRSCVAPAYRTKRTVAFLWQGIWAYAQARRIDVMLGCASLPGTEPACFAQPLSFLRHAAGAPAEWRVPVCAAESVAMDILPPHQIDARAAMRALPPLLKAYLRVGAFVGEGAAIDRQFGTTDVLVILPVWRIQERYLRHFGDSTSQGRLAS